MYTKPVALSTVIPSPPLSPRDRHEVVEGIVESRIKLLQEKGIQGHQTRKLSVKDIKHSMEKRAASKHICLIDDETSSKSSTRSLSRAISASSLDALKQAWKEDEQLQAEDVLTLLEEKKEKVAEFKKKAPPLTRRASFSDAKKNNLLAKDGTPGTASLLLASPIISKKIWQEKVETSLEQFAHKAIKEEKKPCDAKNVLKNFIENHLLNITSIPGRIRHALKVHEECKSLNPLLGIKDPLIFLAKVAEFKEDKIAYGTLLSVIGGEQVLRCLQLCENEKVRSRWVRLVKKTFSRYLLASQVKMKKMTLKQGFDSDFPISGVSRSDAIRVFDSYLTNQANSLPILTINQTSYRCLINFDLIESQKERQLRYLTWLVSLLNKFSNSNTDLEAEEQAKLICCAKMDPDLELKLIGQVDALLSKNSKEDVIDVPSLLRDIAGSACSDQFKAWAKEHLATSIERGWTVASAIVRVQYAEDWLTQVCLNQIPCFSIIQAMSFNAFEKAQDLMKHKYCPALMDKESEDLRLKDFGEDGFHYNLKLDPESNISVITHIKPFRIIKGKTSTPEYLGSIDVNWRLEKRHNKKDFVATLSLENLKLSARKRRKQAKEVCHRLSEC